MKYLLLLLAPLAASAQTVYIQPNISFGKTAIYNLEDDTSLALPSKATFAPAFGINFGKTNGSSFYEAGIYYQSILQNYKGQIIEPNNAVIMASASKKLNYIHVPVLAGKSFLTDRKISPFIQGGLSINYLLNYTTKYYAVFRPFGTSNPATSYKDYVQSGNNIDMQIDKGVIKSNVESSEWYFRKLVIGVNLNFGVNYTLNDKMALRIASYNYVSITNPENSSEMDFIIMSGNDDPLGIGGQGKHRFNPYNRYSSIVNGRYGFGTRGASHLITNSLACSLKYTINTSK
jgi:Outer membrane protein beta-barrel domain